MTYRGKWLNDPKEVLFEVADRVARITLNKPEKRNALSPQTLQDLHDALLEADDRLDVNVIILQGAGKDFCAGYDLAGVYAGRQAESEIEASAYRSSSGSYDDDAWFMERQQALTTVIFDLHKPVIARVHGNCLAGGTDLALMCDFVIVSDEAKIGFPATRANGSPPNHMWIYHCGPQWAKRMLMTGDSILGRDAVTIGLALESAPADQLDACVDELARRLSFVDNELLSAHKRIVNLALEAMGAKTLQRLAAENDARAHLSKGPRRTQFKADMAEHGLKTALTHRDAPFGDGIVRLRRD
ncbi:crotonase/enoyl-CoA hydratase family protein [Brevundimonas sp.]|uniref:crotonase/enoyl-CoA hydratase family protein n=1 Tax=Brevundimonas sp. TaxID=1871086 RepID=UPI002ABA0B8E|nr:crotonase/enoyl-CoA hydratase family protein [Brevundimonas sp.]MDZ4363283.1 crotonase/enoyl-CoA hydratase family protein [Brevundimonas sp.]